MAESNDTPGATTMADLQYFKYTVNLLLKSLEYAATMEVDDEDLRRWLKLSTAALEELQKLAASDKLTRAKKQCCLALITNLVSIKNKLNSVLFKTGGELRQEPSTSALPKQNKVQWDDVNSAFERRIRSGVISNLGHLDIESFLEDARQLFEQKIIAALQEYNALKVNSELSAEYTLHKDDSDKNEIKYFNTKNEPIYKTTNLSEWFKINVHEPLNQQMEEFEERDSGWALQQIMSLIININKFNPMKGSSYLELPKFILNKRACVNVKNNDNKCFMWSVLSALHPIERHSYRVNHYLQYQNELDFKGIEFPVSVKDISKFEKQNPVSINLYILKKIRNNFEVVPCHITSLKKEKHVNLLLVQNFYIDENEEEEEEEGGSEDNSNIELKIHYVWIKNLSRLVSSRLTNHHGSVYICDRCLNFFSSEYKLKNHEIDCIVLNKCKIKLPDKKDSILKFNNNNYKEKVPFVIYADFECLLKPIENDNRKFQKHQAYSIAYYMKCSFDETLSSYYSYRQEEEAKTPAKWFVDQLKIHADNLEQMYKEPKPMKLNNGEMLNFALAKSCHICEKAFKKEDKKVRDHCHFTGKFRGAAHEGCNINYKNSRYIPVIFHNLTGYDSHFIIKEIATSADLKGRVTLIAENKEKYISFTKHIDGSDINFRFIDSFRFMASSLEKLASYLRHHEITSNTFQQDGYTQDQVNLLLRKGVFPYDYVSSFDKLKDLQLPSKEEFHSKLTDSDISDSEYKHAVNVWNKLNIQSLGQYSDIYLKTDVLLLADVFENFRSTCMEAYGLDPAHYYTTPGLTWDAMLKHTKVQLELLTDIDMLLFIERGIRGGISQCCNRYAKANNKYMSEGYNPEEEDKYLMYYDANNLYGWAMTQHLPTGGFEWIRDLNRRDFLTIPDDHCYGYILEVDLEYPWSIHDEHKDLPFCSEHLAPPGSKQKKLMTTLYDKERYVIHYRALKQALKHGVILRKIHRVLRFNQSPWLKTYVDLNTEKRKNAKNEFEKLFFKLLINAVYGKTMENERKRVDVKLVHKWFGRYSAETLIAKPNFHSRSIFGENLVAVQSLRTDITIRKPIYVGLSVLDISKTLIYDFHYSYMKPRFPGMCKLLYTDTDSLIYEIRGKNIYEVMAEDIDKFDTSDYPHDNPFGLPQVNKKVIGLMKDECSGNVMLEFIGLRSKMYCIRVQNDKQIKKAKGVKTSVVNTKLTFEDYEDCLFNKTDIICVQNIIRSKRHNVYTEKQEKLALSSRDDKRHLLPNSTDTLPWGHKSIITNDDEVLLDIPLEGETNGVGGAAGVGETLLKERHSSKRDILTQDELESTSSPPSKRLRL